MTETTVADVVLLDESNYEKTLHLDNPRSELTLTQVRTAFATAISEQWLLGKSGAPIISVPRVTITTTRKVTLE